MGVKRRPRRSTPRRTGPTDWVGRGAGPRLIPALMVTAGGNPVSMLRFTVWEVVSFVRPYEPVPAGLVCRHRMALIVSPGRTGRLTWAPVWILTWAVTFWAVSTVISTWTSRKPRPKKVRKWSGPCGVGRCLRFGTVHVPDRTVNGALNSQLVPAGFPREQPEGGDGLLDHGADFGELRPASARSGGRRRTWWSQAAAIPGWRLGSGRSGMPWRRRSFCVAPSASKSLGTGGYVFKPLILESLAVRLMSTTSLLAWREATPALWRATSC